VSFALMFSVALTVAALQAHAHGAKEKARNMAIGTSFARQILEETRSTSFEKIEYGKTEQSRVVTFTRGKNAGQSKFLGTRLVEKTEVAGHKSVQVTVSWNSGSVDLEGYVGSSD